MRRLWKRPLADITTPPRPVEREPLYSTRLHVECLCGWEVMGTYETVKPAIQDHDARCRVRRQRVAR